MRSFLALLTLALGGCAAFSTEPKNVDVYEPVVQISAQPDWPTVTWHLVVSRAASNRTLDTARIWMQPRAGAIQAFGGAIWSDLAPELFAAELVKAFQDSGRIIAVGRQASGIRADYALLLDLRSFEGAYGSAGPVARVSVHAKLVHYSTNRVFAAQTFEHDAASRSAQVEDVVDAFNVALNRVLTDLVGWTLVTGEANAVTVRAPR